MMYYNGTLYCFCDVFTDKHPIHRQKQMMNATTTKKLHITQLHIIIFSYYIMSFKKIQVCAFVFVNI